MKTEYKPGQKLKVDTRLHGVLDATFVAKHVYPKGAYLEVRHGAAEGTMRYRPAKVTPA